MHTNSYKYGLSGSGSSSYYNHGHAYGINDYLLRAEDMGAWHNTPMVINEEPPSLVVHEEESSNTTPPAGPDECEF